MHRYIYIYIGVAANVKTKVERVGESEGAGEGAQGGLSVLYVGVVSWSGSTGPLSDMSYHSTERVVHAT